MATDRGMMIGTYVSEEFAEAVRVRAFEERCSKGEIIRRALRAYLGPIKTMTGARQKGGGGVPRSRPPAMKPQPVRPAATPDQD